ncbi:Hypothetical protein MELLADRAFT_88366 [Melampsora larici-populina 98AG31]|uniref:Copper acquisition factor BIM1-like domain-containing protein n=1 Tax=Melampsora larici-populina (strain 98AG31 / pathotype 3-4-7) TaxID=747676 RepID=F4RRG5_MELLP|nr:Hypothetical protein MELLADRAFT_88366 [Melampsora larici-populina 98AG31]EGG05037.1 Hypothetical protein MELLADRAFT_88366 [Melampsora larici-populina 98AG31]
MFSKTFSSSLVSLFYLHFTFAHFTLDFPTTRGFNEDKEPSFCGGLPTNASGRQPFPLSGSAPVHITSHHDNAQVAIILSVKADPTKFSDFNSTGKVDYLMPFSNTKGQQGFCFSVDIGTLATQIRPSPTNGTLATLQVIFNGGDHPLFQCSDLILVKNASIASNQTCSNNTMVTPSSNSISTQSSDASQGAKSGAAVNAINFTVFISLIIISTFSIAL